LIFRFDEFELDPDVPELRRSGALVKADTLVLRLLSVLVRRAGQLITKRELVSEVWNDRAVSENVITVSMSRLRRALAHKKGEREFVVNLHGRGYRFVRPVSSVAAEASRWPTGPAAVSDGPPFVGREPVLRRMRALLQAASSGHGAACVLIGEPGIGKTRSVEMLEREAVASGLLVGWGYCRETGDTPPLWPFAQLARDVLARFPIGLLAAQLGAAAAELSRLLPELGAPAQPPPANAPAKLAYDLAGKHRVFDAITRLFALAAEQTPCVLVLDDLHRADTASLELLRYWIDELPRRRVLVLATMRKPLEPKNPHLAEVLGHRNCERIELGRLADSDVRAYVAALLDDPDGTLGSAVSTKSEGNPFFMVELSRQLRDAEHADPTLLSVPAAALDLVRQRVAGLDEEARGVLSCAAVIGRSFELPVLQAVTGREPSTLMASLDRALASELLTAASDSRTGFVFGHELLREALYDALPAGERRRLHLRVAQALEQRASPVLPGDLAYHFHAALPDGDLRKTVQACSDAASAAALVFANGEVVRHLRHALEALDLIEGGSQRLRMSLLLRQAMFARADSASEFMRIVAEVMRVAREQKSGVFLAYAALLLDPHAGFPPMLRSRQALEDALALLPAHDTEMRAAMLARLATTAPAAYDAQQSGSLTQRARELCDEGHSLAGINAVYAAQLYLHGGPAEPELASAVLRDYTHLCEQNPSMLSVAPVMLDVHRAIVSLQRGELGSMSVALERCAARCRELNHHEMTWHVERFLTLRRINAGDFTAGAAALASLHRRADQERVRGTDWFCAYDRAVILGRPIELPEHALALDADDPPSVWSMRVRALTAAGLLEHARAALHRVAAADLARLPCDRDWLGTLGALARAALALQDHAYMDALYALLSPYPEHFAAHISFFCEGSVSQLLGMLAVALDRRAAAVVHFEAAIACSDAAGLTLCAAEARLELAGCLSDDVSTNGLRRRETLEREARSVSARFGASRRR
jgi:DNA-binding winged helix-turn-helix (wHTH) protein